MVLADVAHADDAEPHFAHAVQYKPPFASPKRNLRAFGVPASASNAVPAGNARLTNPADTQRGGF